MTDLVGKTLGRYHILEPLGEGGMAVVYKAYDTRLETDVAVKVIRTERLAPNILEKSLKRFEREAKSLARLTHPHIVKVTDYGEYEGKPYLVMPYLPGGTLKERMKNGAFRWQDAVQLIIPIARALEYAHQQNLIHRDVKPSNILLTESGQPMLTDFGVAKLFDLKESGDLTGTGMGIGTPEYMAPEQWTGKVSPQTDVYASGLVFYEMVTGHRPYIADTPAALFLKQTNESLPRPKSFVAGLPDVVEKVIFKALAKKSEDRYQSMAEFAKELEGLLTWRPPIANAPRRTEWESATVQDLKIKMPIQARPGSARRLVMAILLIGAGATGIVLIFLSILFLNKFTTAVFPTSVPGAIASANITNTPEIASIVKQTSLPPTNTPPPELGIGSTWTRLMDGMLMMYIPEGPFEMGSNNGKYEAPIHTVTLDTFWMDQTEVTNAMYALCVRDEICPPPKETSSYTRSNYYGNPIYNDYPVIQVDWLMAETYCEWAGARLPTEAEWEKAARGTDGRTYPWGEGIDCNYANYSVNCVGDTDKVGGYISGKSPYGLFDMAGNVWEWVLDWGSPNYYANSPSINPQGPTSGEFRVMRGGSWIDTENEVRSSFRGRGVSDQDYRRVGFRCVRSAE